MNVLVIWLLTHRTASTIVFTSLIAMILAVPLTMAYWFASIADRFSAIKGTEPISFWLVLMAFMIIMGVSRTISEKAQSVTFLLMILVGIGLEMSLAGYF